MHTSLFYPYLGENETLALFQMNIDRLERIETERTEIMAIDGAKAMIIEKEDILQFAKEHFKKHKENPDTYVVLHTIRGPAQSLCSNQSHETNKAILLDITSLLSNLKG